MAAKQSGPLAAGSAVALTFIAVTFDCKSQFARDVSFNPVGCRSRQFDEIGCGKSGDYRHRYNNRINMRLKHSETHTQSGYDKCKFTDLSEREARTDGGANILAGDNHTKTAEYNHT